MEFPHGCESHHHHHHHHHHHDYQQNGRGEREEDYPPPGQNLAKYVTNQEYFSRYGQDEHSHGDISFVHDDIQKRRELYPNKRTVRVYCQAGTDYSLSIRDGIVVLASSDPNDMFQHWIKDEKYSTKVEDEEGFPCFALVNKATGLALKHSVGATHPVQLIPYCPDFLDETILWTQSKDMGEGFRAIRMVNNIRLNLDAFHGDKNHGVHDGTTLVLWEWNHGENQKWKITPYCNFFISSTFILSWQ